MRWVALMPLRGGSRSIPDKNLRPIAGRPLFAWSLEQAVASECFDEVFVSTDSQEIATCVRHGMDSTVTVIDRSAVTATDTASTELAMLEFQSRNSFDVVCLVQATSPLTTAPDFRAAKQKFVSEKLDSLLEVGSLDVTMQPIDLGAVIVGDHNGRITRHRELLA